MNNDESVTKKDLISVIIPIYNRADVLHRPVESILKQSYQNFELLLIDDGSTDQSYSLCLDYAKKDPRIRVYHKENGGVSSARNMGLMNCRGDYIYFIDSDDIASPHLIEKLHDDLVKYHADCAFCNLKCSDDDNEDFEVLDDDPEIMDWNRAYSLHEYEGRINWTPGVHFYRRSVVMEPEQILFPENCNYGEDKKWFSHVIQRCSKAVADRSVLLLYFSDSDNRLSDNATLGMQLSSRLSGYKFLIEHDFPQEEIDYTALGIDNLFVSFLLNNGAPDEKSETKGLKKIETVQEIQKICLEILKFFDKLCRENHLTYFLCGGTLLGAIRHKGFIPWDDDIDVCMPRKDFNRMIEIMNGYSDRYRLFYPGCSNEYYYSFGKIVDGSTILHECGYNRIQGLGVYLDVFPLDGLPDDKEDRLEHIRNAEHTSRLLGFFALENQDSLLLKRMILRRLQNQLKTSLEEFDFYSTQKSFIIHGANCIRTVCDRKSYGKGAECLFEGCSFMIPSDPDAVLTQLYGNYLELPPESERVSHHTFDAWYR